MSIQLTRRGVIGSLGAIAVGAGLSACGSSSSSSPGSAGSGGGGGTKTLQMFNYDNPAQAARTKEVLAAYTKSSGVNVTLDTLPGSGAAIYPGKLRTQILGGSAPDLFKCWGGTIAKPFVDTKQVIPLDAVYQKYGWDSSLSSASINDLSYNGKKYGVPTKASSVGVWYNTDLLAKSGQGVPTTFAEVETINAALVKAGVQPWLAGGKYGWDVMRFFEWFLEHTAGPVEHDKLRNAQTSWNTSSVVEAFALLQKWAKNKWLPDGVMALDPTQVEAQFTAEKAAFALDGQWIEQDIVAAKRPASSYGTFIPPTDQTPLRYSGFTEGYFITTQSKDPSDAEALIDFYLKPSSQETMENAYTTVKAVPAMKGFPGSAQWKKWGATHQHYVIQDQSLTTDQSNSYFSIQSNVVQGNQTPADAAAAMAKAVPVSN